MYNKKQRFAALLGIILLVLLYLATLLCAIFDFDGSLRLFQACLFATIAVPILIWIYVYLFGKLNNKKTFASFDTSEEPKETTSDDIVETVTVSKRKPRKK